MLNDNFRSTFIGGHVVLTSGVSELPIDVKAKALLMVKTFKDFTKDNDPHGEHDFGSFEVAGDTFFWKIDYYDLDCRVWVGRPERSGENDARAHDHARRRVLSHAAERTARLHARRVHRRAQERRLVLRSQRALRRKEEMKGPYSSVSSVTLVIARQLKREIANVSPARGRGVRWRLPSSSSKASAMLWKEILKLRREQRKAARQPQLTLFELKEDSRPASQRTAEGRYTEPMLFRVD